MFAPYANESSVQLVRSRRTADITCHTTAGRNQPSVAELTSHLCNQVNIKTTTVVPLMPNGQPAPGKLLVHRRSSCDVHQRSLRLKGGMCTRNLHVVLHTVRAMGGIQRLPSLASRMHFINPHTFFIAHRPTLCCLDMSFWGLSSE